MQYSISTYFIYFLILAMLGWIMEVSLQLVQKHKFSNRGFLIGPYCPIYGCGGLAITLSLSHMSNHPISLFCTAIIICGILEYLTSYLMEKMFNARWWDYSQNKYNINGRVCLETIIPFGLLGMLLIYVLNPFVFGMIEKIPNTIVNVLAAILAILFTTDIIISYRVISNVRKATRKFDKENPKDSTDEISKKVREFLKSKSILNRRLVNAFPEFTAILRERKEQIKQKTQEIREDLESKAEELKEDLSQKAEEVKAKFKIDKEHKNL